MRITIIIFILIKWLNVLGSDGFIYGQLRLIKLIWMSGKRLHSSFKLFKNSSNRFIYLINTICSPPPPTRWCTMRFQCLWPFFFSMASVLFRGDGQGGRGVAVGEGLQSCDDGEEGGANFANYPSVPFLLGALALRPVPSGCWPSLRGGILSFIRSRPRASSKFRIFLVGEKPWMAAGHRADTRGRC